MAPRAKNGRFIKKGEAKRREVASKNANLRNNKVRKLKEQRAQKQRNEKQREELAHLGRDIWDREALANNMWCEDCENPLSLRFQEKVTYIGLAAIMHVRCHKCNKLHKVSTSKKVLSGNGKTLFAVNCKAAASKHVFHLFCKA